MKKFALVLFTLSLTLVFGLSLIAETHIPITDSGPIKPRDTIPSAPIKPKAPTLKSISCSLDNDVVIVRSIVEQTAEIIIYDRDYGFVRHHTLDNNLYPEVKISVTGYAGNFIIMIIIDDATYQGEFEIS